MTGEKVPSWSPALQERRTLGGGRELAHPVDVGCGAHGSYSPLFTPGRTYTVLAALWAWPIPRTALEGREIVSRVCPCVCVVGIWRVSGSAVCVVHLCCVLMCGDWRMCIYGILVVHAHVYL